MKGKDKTKINLYLLGLTEMVIHLKSYTAILTLYDICQLLKLKKVKVKSKNSFCPRQKSAHACAFLL